MAEPEVSCAIVRLAEPNHLKVVLDATEEGLLSP